MKDLKFRPCTADDYDACMKIFMSNTPQFFGSEEAGDFRKFLETLPCPYFVATLNGEVAACGGYGHDHAKGTVVLAWGMVRADLHKQGLGSFMLVERMKQIYEDCGEIVVQIDTSQHSKGFFAKYGFEATGFTENFYAPGIHRVDMELKLDAERQRAFENLGGRQE